MIVCVSANALSRSSSLGRIVASFRPGYFSASRLLDEGDPLVLVGRAERAGDDRELALAAQQPRRFVGQRVARCPSGVAWLTKKSRASGSASASQVSTLMPRSRALRSTVEMPARFSTATAIASTLRVIQFSTSSFCLAASRPVGPSQISSTPSSCAASSAPARQLTKYGIALGLRHHRDDRPPRRVAGLPPRRSRRRRGDGRSERTSHTLVPATISAPARIAAQSTAT